MSLQLYSGTYRTEMRPAYAQDPRRSLYQREVHCRLEGLHSQYKLLVFQAVRSWTPTMLKKLSRKLTRVFEDPIDYSNKLVCILKLPLSNTCCFTNSCTPTLLVRTTLDDNHHKSSVSLENRRYDGSNPNWNAYVT